MSTFYTGLTGDLSIARLGKPGGFAPLGPDNKIPSTNLPAGLTGGLSLQGGYDANTNTPDLTAAPQQNDGALYIVTVEGTQDIGNGSELFTVGDSVFYSTADSRWYKLEGTTIANSQGLYTSYNAVNYTPADNDNVTSHFEAIDTEIGSLQTALVDKVNKYTFGTVINSGSGNAVINELSLIDSSTSVISVVPPSSPQPYDKFAISDVANNASVNNIIIEFITANQPIFSSIDNYTINEDGGFVEFLYINSSIGWITIKG